MGSRIPISTLAALSMVAGVPLAGFKAKGPREVTAHDLARIEAAKAKRARKAARKSAPAAQETEEKR